jgi:hypothetical protein
LKALLLYRLVGADLRHRHCPAEFWSFQHSLVVCAPATAALPLRNHWEEVSVDNSGNGAPLELLSHGNSNRYVAISHTYRKVQCFRRPHQTHKHSQSRTSPSVQVRKGHGDLPSDRIRRFHRRECSTRP